MVIWNANPDFATFDLSFSFWMRPTPKAFFGKWSRSERKCQDPKRSWQFETDLMLFVTFAELPTHCHWHAILVVVAVVVEVVVVVVEVEVVVVVVEVEVVNYCNTFAELSMTRCHWHVREALKKWPESQLVEKTWCGKNPSEPKWRSKLKYTGSAYHHNEYLSKIKRALWQSHFKQASSLSRRTGKDAAN